ncbi:hypothetical protein E2C01_061994 [Portunus trituberculatus]|uniref:Uncharacterized protein n=1 Tax=Portunus trituberculatus TaxID=210409 RepID=A0A5B7HFV3_PORTR|nr:hypothetical protein [Portunus trituberculatus]
MGASLPACLPASRLRIPPAEAETHRQLRTHRRAGRVTARVTPAAASDEVHIFGWILGKLCIRQLALCLLPKPFLNFHEEWQAWRGSLGTMSLPHVWPHSSRLSPAPRPPTPPLLFYILLPVSFCLAAGR